MRVAAWLSLAALVACSRRSEPAAEAPKAVAALQLAVADTPPVEDADAAARRVSKQPKALDRDLTGRSGPDLSSFGSRLRFAAKVLGF